MTLIIDQFPCKSDNFGVLIHDTTSGLTAAIDAPEFDPIKHRLAERGWRLDRILVTHHHADHTEAILPLKQATDAKQATTARSPARRRRPTRSRASTTR